MPLLRAGDLTSFCRGLLITVGVAPKDADTVAKHITRAHLAGYPSHGLIRLLTYVERVRKGVIKTDTKIKIISRRGEVVLLDAGGGFGQVTCVSAMQLAIRIAKERGIAAIGIRNCNHVGRLADYTKMAADRGMISMVIVNSASAVAPYGGTERILGGNPICWAFPVPGGNPILFDMSTSATTKGDLMIRKANKEPIPTGLIVTSDGKPTSNPEDFFKGGAILPFGGYKGYGLALVADLLAGALTGAGSGSLLREPENGVFILVMSLTHFDKEVYAANVSHLISQIKNCRRQDTVNEILLPGERERRSADAQLKTGIRVDDATWKMALELAHSIGYNAEQVTLIETRLQKQRSKGM